MVTGVTLMQEMARLAVGRADARRVRYVRMPPMRFRLITKLDRIDCLILDYLGYVRKDQSVSSILFELIAERYEHRSLIITCDRPFSDWASIFADQTMTVSIRLWAHHGLRIRGTRCALGCIFVLT